MLQELQNAFSTPSQAIGHISFLLLIVSMMMRNMSWLRIMVIASGVVGIIYRFYFINDPVTVLWNFALVAVNVVQLALSWIAHLRARFTEDEAHFVATIVPYLPRALAHKLVRAGQLRDFGEGDQLTTDQRIVSELMFLVHGKVWIEKTGQRVAACHRGDYVGEMSFITGEPATADAFAAEATRCLCFERTALRQLLDREPEIRSALDASFSRNLIEKLVKSNQTALTAAQTRAGVA